MDGVFGIRRPRRVSRREPQSTGLKILTNEPTWSVSLFWPWPRLMKKLPKQLSRGSMSLLSVCLSYWILWTVWQKEERTLTPAIRTFRVQTGLCHGEVD